MGLLQRFFRSKSARRKINVNVRVAGIIEMKPVNQGFVISVNEESDIIEVFRIIEERVGFRKGVLRESLKSGRGESILLNGERLSMPDGIKKKLNDGDELSILSAIAGGGDLKESYFSSFDRTRIFFQVWMAEKPLLSLIIVHGLGEHSGRYSRLAGDFTKEGISLFGFDLRGHGRSGGRRGHIMSFSDYLYDLDNFIKLIIKTLNTPLFLLGHSMGGLVAMNYAIKNPGNISGLITSSPLLRLAVRVPGWKAALARFLSRRMPWVAMNNGLDPNLLSHDRDVVKKYLEDPLVHRRVTARWFTEVILSMENLRRTASGLKVPVLMLHAGNDRLTDPAGSEEIFSLLDVKDKTLKIYKDFYHELYNEIERERPIRDTVEWLLRRYSTHSAV